MNADPVPLSSLAASSVESGSPIDGSPTDDSPPGGWQTPRSAYLHVPFCRHRCGYCNFSVLAGRDDLADDFLRAIDCELSSLDSPKTIDTLFIGGGTPTHLTLSQLSHLFNSIDRWLPRSTHAETSVEANPEDIEPETLRLLADRGVNRISLGVQSFESGKLQQLQRGHSGEAAQRAVQSCAEVIGNVSLDLIFGSPGETIDNWRRDLATALSLPIRHLSTYALTFEKGTQFWTERLRGNLREACEDDELTMYQDAMQCASEAGLKHYEISSFARDGFRCRHNLAYWEGKGWFAFGPGAANFVDGFREVNHRSTTTYLKKIQEGHSPVAQREAISVSQYACERAAFGIRMIEGVDLDTIARESGVDVLALRHRELDQCQRNGLICVEGSHYRLTPRGILMADSVATAFLG
jgi:oxygen-independent coproporphyrinogen III oxidase